MSTPSDTSVRLVELPKPTDNVAVHSAHGEGGPGDSNSDSKGKDLTTVPLAHTHTINESSADSTPADVHLYQSIVGSLIHLSIATRPDIANAVNIVSRFAARPSQAHLAAAKRIIRYLGGTRHAGIVLGSTNTATLEIYSDADWAGDLTTRKSTGGFLATYNGPVSWSSKRQSVVALSSTEAEYMAVTQATKEAIWIRSLLKDLGDEQLEPTTIYEDNQSCIALAKNPVHHARSKHIDIQYHFVREQIILGAVVLKYLETKEMTTDVLTKPLPRPAFERLILKMGLQDFRKDKDTSGGV